MKTLEETEQDFLFREFGKCKGCGRTFQYNDKFIDIAEGVCGSSQGYPCAYVDETERWHPDCWKRG